MIDLTKLKDIVRLMVENDLTELDLKDEKETVVLRRGQTAGTVVNHQPVIYQGVPGGPGSPGAHAAAAAFAAPVGSVGAVPAVPADAGLIAIESPMVGTFYTSPNPDAPAFVSPGTTIAPGTVVCLIEAMKVFNEIKAEVSGTVQSVLTKSGQAVEFGQRLILVKPS